MRGMVDKNLVFRKKVWFFAVVVVKNDHERQIWKTLQIYDNPEWVTKPAYVCPKPTCQCWHSSLNSRNSCRGKVLEHRLLLSTHTHPPTWTHTLQSGHCRIERDRDRGRWRDAKTDIGLFCYLYD